MESNQIRHSFSSSDRFCVVCISRKGPLVISSQSCMEKLSKSRNKEYGHFQQGVLEGWQKRANGVATCGMGLGACLRSFAAFLCAHQNRQLRRLRSSQCSTCFFLPYGLFKPFRLRSRDGTTDVTRTWHFGAPTKWERVSRTWVTWCFTFKSAVQYVDYTAKQSGFKIVNGVISLL